jgi:hypothetical protein
LLSLFALVGDAALAPVAGAAVTPSDDPEIGGKLEP